MWHPNIWRAHRSQCSRPRLSTAPALGELRNQHRSPSPARWSFSVWSQPPWPSARGRQGASDVVTARLHVRPGQRPAPNVVGPCGPGSPAALELAKDKSSQPSVPPRSVPPLSPAKVTHAGRRLLKPALSTCKNGRFSEVFCNLAPSSVVLGHGFSQKARVFDGFPC